MSSSASRRWRLSLGAAAMLAFSAAGAQVAIGTTGIDDSGNYQSELQACRTGHTAEDQPTCVREARNAQADKRRGVLGNGNGDFEANARARCDPLKGDDKAACEARMSGQGEVSGSIAGGGLLREIETVVSEPPMGQAAVPPSFSAPAMGAPAAPAQ